MGVVLYLGNDKGRGGARKWGGHLVGSKKALVMIDKVLVPLYKPQFRLVNNDNHLETWQEGATLGDLYDNDSGLVVMASIGQLHVDLSLPVEKKPCGDLQGGSGTATLGTEDAEVKVSVYDDIAVSVNVDVQVAPAACHFIRSRMKGDIFHQFDALPIGRHCPVGPAIYQLMIMATFEKDKQDDKAIREVLASKKGVTDFTTHEYFNKEYWRTRVRMKTPEASEHAANIRTIHSFIREEPAFAEFYTSEMETFLSALSNDASWGGTKKSLIVMCTSPRALLTRMDLSCGIGIGALFVSRTTIRSLILQLDHGRLEQGLATTSCSCEHTVIV